jgi:hypothetical protein
MRGKLSQHRKTAGMRKARRRNQVADRGRDECRRVQRDELGVDLVEQRARRAAGLRQHGKNIDPRRCRRYGAGLRHHIAAVNSVVANSVRNHACEFLAYRNADGAGEFVDRRDRKHKRHDLIGRGLRIARLLRCPRRVNLGERGGWRDQSRSDQVVNLDCSLFEAVIVIGNDLGRRAVFRIDQFETGHAVVEDGQNERRVGARQAPGNRFQHNVEQVRSRPVMREFGQRETDGGLQELRSATRDAGQQFGRLGQGQPARGNRGLDARHRAGSVGAGAARDRRREPLAEGARQRAGRCSNQNFQRGTEADAVISHAGTEGRGSLLGRQRAATDDSFEVGANAGSSCDVGTARQPFQDVKELVRRDRRRGRAHQGAEFNDRSMRGGLAGCDQRSDAGCRCVRKTQLRKARGNVEALKGEKRVGDNGVTHHGGHRCRIEICDVRDQLRADKRIDASRAYCDRVGLRH